MAIYWFCSLSFFLLVLFTVYLQFVLFILVLHQAQFSGFGFKSLSLFRPCSSNSRHFRLDFVGLFGHLVQGCGIGPESRHVELPVTVQTGPVHDTDGSQKVETKLR